MAEWLRSRTGEDNPKYNRIEKTCDGCGSNFAAQPCESDRKYCSQTCYFKNWEAPTGAESHSWKGGKEDYHCDQCGEVFQRYPDREHPRRFCSRTCYAKFRSEQYVGENHHLWKGGHVGYYGPNWKDKRKDALEKFDKKCAICGRGEEELGKHPDVHHIVPVREFDNPNDAHSLDNLVVLCKEHHMQVEGWHIMPDVREKIEA